MSQLVEAFKDHPAADIYAACTAVLAANDVLNGVPDFTLRYGPRDISNKVDVFSRFTYEYMQVHSRLPTLAHVLDAYIGELDQGVKVQRLRSTS
jgi:hypothetical protein